jgi:chromosome partitioning protein
MHIVTFASFSARAGKSTLAAHFAAAAMRSGRLCLPIDADPKGSLTEWKARSRRPWPVANGTHGLDYVLRVARRYQCDQVVIDTPSSDSRQAIEAIGVADLVVIPVWAIPFDAAAVEKTVRAARAANSPYFAVINGAPEASDQARSAVASARGRLERLGIPVWSRQISRRVAYAMSFATGRSVLDLNPKSAESGEIANLWVAVSRVFGMIAGDAKATLGWAA